MANPSDLSNMSFYEFKLNEAKDIFKEAVVVEDEHYVIIDGSKLQECHAICRTLTEKRAKIPLDIQAQANYYLSVGEKISEPVVQLYLYSWYPKGRSDDVAVEYLQNAVGHCQNFEGITGEDVRGCDTILGTLLKMQDAVHAEQSEYGGVSVRSAATSEKGRNGGLLQSRGLPTMTITAPSPKSGSRRKLPTAQAKHIKQESLSDEDDKKLVRGLNFSSATEA